MQWPKPNDDDDDDDRTWLANLLCKRKYGISLLSGNGAAAIEIVLRRKKKERKTNEGGRREMPQPELVQLELGAAGARKSHKLYNSLPGHCCCCLLLLCCCVVCFANLLPNCVCRCILCYGQHGQLGPK